MSSLKGEPTVDPISTTSLQGFNGGLRPLPWSKWNTKEFWLGDYDYAMLFMPYIPKVTSEKYKNREMPFFSANEPLPILLMLLLSVQHCLAMLGGLVTPPLLLGGAGGAALAPAQQAYLISASLIICGLSTALQVSSIKLPFGYRLGSGVLTVTGTSFAFIGSSLGYINSQYAEGGICQLDASGNKLPCEAALGAVLGSATVVGIIAIFMSFTPAKIIRKLFPPMVTGAIMTLIGCSLISSGITNWAGGSGPCASDFTKACVKGATWGSARLIGLGFLVFASIVVFDLFGPPMVRNCSVFLGLVLGMIVAAGTGYFNGAAIDRAPVITFNWVHRFPLSVKGDLVLPFLASFIVVLSETVGNVTATCSVSGLPITGEDFSKRIQGGMLADTLFACLAGLATVSPLTTFSQNIGVIGFTRNGSRWSGYGCALLLVLAGIFGKVGSLFVAMPPSVLGGLTTFLFGSVAITGIRLLAMGCCVTLPRPMATEHGHRTFAAQHDDGKRPGTRMMATTRALLFVSAGLTAAIAQGEPFARIGIQRALNELEAIQELPEVRSWSSNPISKSIFDAKRLLKEALARSDELPLLALHAINEAAGVAQAPRSTLPWELVDRIITFALDFNSYNYDYRLRQLTLLSLIRVSRHFHDKVRPVVARELHFTSTAQYEKYYNASIRHSTSKSARRARDLTLSYSADNLSEDDEPESFPQIDFVSHAWNLDDTSTEDSRGGNHSWTFVLPVLRCIGSVRVVHLSLQISLTPDREGVHQALSRVAHEAYQFETLNTVQEFRLTLDGCGDSAGRMIFPELLLWAESLRSLVVTVKPGQTLDRVGDLTDWEPTEAPQRRWHELVVRTCHIQLQTLLELLSDDMVNNPLRSLDVNGYVDQESFASARDLVQPLYSRIPKTITHLGIGLGYLDDDGPQDEPRRGYCKWMTEQYFDCIESCQGLRHLRLALQYFHKSTVMKRTRRLALMPLLKNLVIDAPFSLLEYADKGSDLPRSIGDQFDFLNILLPFLQDVRAFSALQNIELVLTGGTEHRTKDLWGRTRNESQTFRQVCALRNISLSISWLSNEAGWHPRE
ncbi:hypothetical protein OIV83_006232 [Microbotryomycetes sp. JL201]|nr:hypothetical protein OIV83_006232 [Microbotryomycetes sp. JL201]